jgi:2-polyprenyl-3-methyl-5-hydroxy-6-metoxy-1,4-benzoquinol methylase
MEDTNKNLNPSYTTSRKDIQSLIPDNANKILDVGCSTGILGYQIKQKNKNVEVIGIEIDEEMAKIAKNRLDRVIVGDVEKIDFKKYFEPDYFDCIILADILEHLSMGCSSPPYLPPSKVSP